MDNKFKTLDRYKRALPIMQEHLLPCDYIRDQILLLEADLGFNSKRINLDKIWEEESKKALYSCYITPEEAAIIQQYGRLKEDKLEQRLNYIKKKKNNTIPIKETLREQIEKIEF